MGKLLGPKGNSMKRLQEETMCKMAVLGRGSMKDRQKVSYLLTINICAKPKNRMRNLVSFLLKCKKRGTLVGPTFSGTFFGQKYGKNSAASKQK